MLDPVVIRRTRRLLGLRKVVLALAVPLILFVALESGLRLARHGYDLSFFIPGPHAGTQVSNPRFAWRFFDRQIARPPLPIVLPAVKAEHAYRVFVFGGSAALGDPDASVSFARILEAMLVQRFPSVRFEVVNTGMTAINSHVARVIARQCMAYEPDLFLVYLGNNEVIGPYGLKSMGTSGAPLRLLIRAADRLRTTRTVQAAQALAARARDPLAVSTNRWRGMQMFLDRSAPLGDPRLERVYAHCAANLADICAAGRHAGADVVLCTILTNLQDCPPFHSRHRPALTTDERTAWDAALRRGDEHRAAHALHDALAEYARAAAIDDAVAALHYRMGRCLLELEDPEEARRHLTRARDLDTFRFRADSRINDLIRETAAGRAGPGIQLLDVADALITQARAEGGLPGSSWLYDHVHMTFEGNHAIAATLFPAVAARVSARFGISPSDLAPPAREACATWLGHSEFGEFEGAKSMAARMSAPPFTPEQGQAAQRAMQERLEKLSPPLLEAQAAHIETRLVIRPDDLLLRANLARILYVLEDNEGAANQYQRLLARYPYASDWQYSLGDSLAALHRWREAEAWLRASLRLEPANGETHRCLGHLLFQAGRFDEAVRQYKQAVALNPSDLRTHVELAQLYHQMGDIRTARRHEEIARRLRNR